VVMGPGRGAVGAPDVLLDLPPKMLLKVCWVTELRRCRGGPSMGGLLRSLLDMVEVGFALVDISSSFDTRANILQVELVVVGWEILWMTRMFALQLRRDQ
jgi:hypothetical protein